MMTLCELRKQHGYTQEQLATKLKIGVSTYNQYENGTRSVPAPVAEAISTLFGVQTADIFSPKYFTVSKT